MDRLQEIFRTEAEELIADLERALLSFEKNFSNQEAIQEIFRVMHTLKGSSSMFGYEKLSELTHNLETIYDSIRSSSLVASPEIFEVTLHCLDHIKNLITDPNLSQIRNLNKHQSLLRDIEKLSNEDTEVNADQTSNHSNTSCTYYVLFCPSATVFKNGFNPLFLLDELATLGEVKVIPNTEAIPVLDEYNSTDCYLSFEIILFSNHVVDKIKDVFIFVEDESEIVIEKLANENLITNRNFLDILPEYEYTYPARTILGFDIIKKIVEGLKEVKDEKEITQVIKTDSSTIRVSSDKLDELMNLISELVTSQARLSLLASQQGASELAVVAETMEKLTRRLRDNAFNICLVPIESLAVRFQRLVRDLSKDLHKQIEFITEGTETELDRSIIEKIADPVLHILRNSIDHGIELPEDRIKAIKNPVGKIVFKAYQAGTHIFVQISDDGKGIDPSKIKSKAIAKGLITEESTLTEQDILQLVFAPGFSTAEKVTDVSGRGVGMDIVKRNIESIHGEVSISSKVGIGTSITIKLPLTLSILDGMLVNIGGSRYLLPLSAIHMCYEIETNKLSQDAMQKHVIDGRLLPVVNLHAVFSSKKQRSAITQIIEINYDEFPVGISVDAIIGEYQAVMKPLGDLYQNQDEFSGATILGDGTVALVIDTTTLIRQIINKERKVA